MILNDLRKQSEQQEVVEEPKNLTDRSLNVNSFTPPSDLSPQEIETPEDALLEQAKQALGGLAAFFDMQQLLYLEEKFNDNEEAITLLKTFIDRLIATQQLVGVSETQNYAKT
jgi:hypothetical protein